MFCAATTTFSFPWPQHDITPCEVNSPALKHKILIAARATSFKKAVIEKIREAFKNDSVYVKCIGLKSLINENAETYDAILIVNTCMALSMDKQVNLFLKKQKKLQNIIVYTTSGSGDWTPNRKKFDVDAVASASVKTGVAGVAGELILRIKQKILLK